MYSYILVTCSTQRVRMYTSTLRTHIFHSAKNHQQGAKRRKHYKKQPIHFLPLLSGWIIQQGNFCWGTRDEN